MSEESARLFVAVWPPDDVLDALAELPRPDEAGVRYTTRAQWHVTLRFLGSCQLHEALAAFERVAAAPRVAVLGPALLPVRLSNADVCRPRSAARRLARSAGRCRR